MLTGSRLLNIFNVDAWDGYQVARDRLMTFLADNSIANPVVLTGDIHSSWAADLKSDFTERRCTNSRRGVRVQRDHVGLRR